jgi:hypothetical protein
MATSLEHKMPEPKISEPKAPAIYHGQIHAPAGTSGIVTHMPAAADEAKLVVLNSLGEVVSETGHRVSEEGLVTLNFSEALERKAGKEDYYLLVKGYLKGALAWEQRLGRFHFHA